MKMFGKEVPKNVKCDCGHTIKDHFQGGWCHSSGHPKESQCGCTWYHPNVNYIKRKKKEYEKVLSKTVL
jgi:hypothetical protein